MPDKDRLATPDETRKRFFGSGEVAVVMVVVVVVVVVSNAWESPCTFFACAKYSIMTQQAREPGERVMINRRTSKLVTRDGARMRCSRGAEKDMTTMPPTLPRCEGGGSIERRVSSRRCKLASVLGNASCVCSWVV